jgi:hypothetical protein
VKRYAPLKREDAKVNKPDMAGCRGCPAAADTGRNVEFTQKEQARDRETRAAVFELMTAAAKLYGIEPGEVYIIR